MRHATIAPYGPFRAGDGKTGVFRIQNEREWLSLCTNVLDDADLAIDPRFVTNPDRMTNATSSRRPIESRTAGATSDQLLAQLEQASIANARLNSVEEFLDHPQLA